MESNKSAALASSLTGIICDVRIRRSAGEHRTRLTSANRQRRRHWPPDAMARRGREFVDSRLRRSPPDRASAVPYGQAGENAMRFPRLAHRSAAAHKLHSTTDGSESWNRQPAAATWTGAAYDPAWDGNSGTGRTASGYRHERDSQSPSSSHEVVRCRLQVRTRLAAGGGS